LNRELADRWDIPELGQDALAVARAARMVGRIMGYSRRDTESLFVAGLLSSAGAAALLSQDAGYLAWRVNQWIKGISEEQLLHREQMAYRVDHVVAAARLLDEWNMPTAIIDAVSSHHAPRSRFDLALWAGMTITGPSSPARCHDLPFSTAMEELGLSEHVDSVRVEALRYAEAVLGETRSLDPARRGRELAAQAG